MSKTALIAIICAATGLTLASWLLLDRPSQPPATKAGIVDSSTVPPSPLVGDAPGASTDPVADNWTDETCAWRVGERLRYRLVQSSRHRLEPTVLVGGGASASPSTWQSKHIEGEIHAEVLASWNPTPAKRGSRNFVLAFSLAADRFEISGQQPPAETLESLAAPVFVRVDERCHFHAVAAQPDAPAFVVGEWAPLLAMIDTRSSSGPESELKWHAEQADALGRFRVDYRRDPQDRWIRNKRGYTHTHALAPGRSTKVEILGARAIFEPARSGRFFERAQIREHLRVFADERDFAEVDTRVELESRPLDPRAPAMVGAEQRQAEFFRGLNWRSLAAPPQFNRVSDPFAQLPERPDLAQRSFESIWGEASELLARAEADSKAREEALALLVAYLRLSREHVDRVLEHLQRANRGDASARSYLYLALERTGSPAARRALAQLARDENLTQIDRVRAVSAMSDALGANEDSVRELQSIARHAQDESIQGSARLALGTLSSREGLSEETRRELTRDLRTQIEGAVDGDQRIEATRAIANSAQPDLAPAIADGLEDEDGRVRAATLVALADLGQSPAADELWAIVRDDDFPSARQIAAEQLASHKVLSDAIVSQLGQRLRQSPQESRELELWIVIAGPHAQSQPELTSGLIHAFQQSDDPDIMRAIGRYLPADVL